MNFEAGTEKCGDSQALRTSPSNAAVKRRRPRKAFSEVSLTQTTSVSGYEPNCSLRINFLSIAKAIAFWETHPTSYLSGEGQDSDDPPNHLAFTPDFGKMIFCAGPARQIQFGQTVVLDFFNIGRAGTSRH